MPSISPPTSDTPTPPRKGYGRRRAIVLILVHLVIAIHIATWLILGETLAPLELNETMFTLELGIVTVGFIFMGLIVLSSLIFGRFFCSWGCHVLALQDLAAWILEKIHIQPKPVRSRLLLLGPLAVMAAMFIWPQIERMTDGRPFPSLHLSTDKEGFGSLITSDFLRNLPGPGITILTFLICGGLIVYLLGSRSFCRYVCPYGAIFSLSDRIAPSRIRLDAGADCASCAACTAACSSDIRVHEEIKRFGAVVSPSCLKDLDCVAACPSGALRWGWARPSGWRSWSSASRHRRYDFTWGEELAALAVGVIGFFAFRSLYGQVPLLLAAALGVLAGWATVLIIHTIRRRDLRLKPFQLKRAGRIRLVGWVAGGLAVAFLAFTVHSSVVRLHEHRVHQLWPQVEAGHAGSVQAGYELMQELDWIHQWGLWTPPYVNDRLARTAILLNRPDQAIEPLERLSKQWPSSNRVKAVLRDARAASGHADDG
ncbi:MAG: 4Fe-4S binding protein [Planctomycetes bacterium]|jgi:polyferredoxin|nr:4Fe-4S binding protein [Planctomycetota bacterium]